MKGMGNIRAGTLIKFTKRLTVKCESWHPTNICNFQRCGS